MYSKSGDVRMAAPVQAVTKLMLMCHHAIDMEHRDGLERDYAVVTGVS